MGKFWIGVLVTIVALVVVGFVVVYIGAMIFQGGHV